MRRFLALILCMVMVVGLLPSTAFAAEEDTDYLFIATDRHENTSIIGELIDSMEADIGENKLEYLGLGGDMVGSGSNHPAYNSSTVLAEATGATSSLSATNVDIVAGIHDMNVTDDAGIVLPYSGGGAKIYEGDKYYIYGVTEGCISGEVSNVDPAEEAQAFVTWANSVDTSKVIILVSHYPLHAKRGDNVGAGYWHNALNTVATGSATGTEVIRDLVFFHGHNHTVDSNEYCYAPGSTMSIENYVDPSGVAAVSEAEIMTIYDEEIAAYASASGTSATIYYTYATAGYLKQNSNATLMAITDDTITLTKYGTGSSSAMTSVERVVTAPTATSLEVTGETAYTVGDAFVEPSVYVHYSNGSGKTLTAEEYTVSGAYDMSAAGTYTLTYTYEGVSADYTFTVEAAAKTIKYVTPNEGTGGVYTVGDKKILYSLVVTYSDGTTATVTQDVCNVDSVAIYPSGESVTMDYALANAGNYTATVSYQGVACGTKLYFSVTDNGTSNYDLLDLVINGAEVTANVEDVTEDEAVAAAMAAVEGVSEFVAYDIAATLTGASATVTIPVPATWTEDSLRVYYITDEGTVSDETFDHTYADGKVTFTTTHFSTWAVAGNAATVGDVTLENVTATVPGADSTTTTQMVATEYTVYKLVDAPVSGKEYLIVNSNTGTGYGLDGDTAGYATTAFTGGSDYYSTWDDTSKTGTDFSAGSDVYLTTSGAYLWTAGSNSFTIGYTQSSSGGLFSDTTYSYTLNPAGSDNGSWSISNNNLKINLITVSPAAFWESDTYTDYYLTNSESSWSMATGSGSNVYFYEPVTIYSVSEEQVITPATPDIVYSIEGADMELWAVAATTVEPTYTIKGTYQDDSGTVTDGSELSGTVSYTVISDASGILSVSEDGTVATLTGQAGTAVVRISYSWTAGENTYTIYDDITVTANAPTYTIDITHDDDGDGTYTSITETIAIKGETAMAAGYSLSYAVSLVGAEGSTAVTPTEGSISWKSSDESRATVDANGKVTFVGEGTVLIAVTYTDPNGEQQSDTVTFLVTKSTLTAEDTPEYPNDGAVRFDKTASAVGNFSETGIAKVELSMTGVPYSTGNELDVTLLLDWTNSMDNAVGSSGDTRKTATVDATIAFIKSIVLNEDGTLNSNRILIYVFEKNAVGWLNLTGITTEGYQTITEDLIESYAGDTTEEKLENFLKAKITTTTLGNAKSSDNSTYQGSFDTPFWNMPRLVR